MKSMNRIKQTKYPYQNLLLPVLYQGTTGVPGNRGTLWVGSGRVPQHAAKMSVESAAADPGRNLGVSRRTKSEIP